MVSGIAASSDAGLTDAVDQLVVSPRLQGLAPQALIAVDSEFKGFFSTVLAWYEDAV